MSDTQDDIKPGAILHSPAYGWVEVVRPHPTSESILLVRFLQRYLGGPACHQPPEAWLGNCSELSDVDHDGQTYEGKPEKPVDGWDGTDWDDNTTAKSGLEWR